MESHDLAEMNPIPNTGLELGCLGQLKKRYSPGLVHVKRADLNNLIMQS